MFGLGPTELIIILVIFGLPLFLIVKAINTEGETKYCNNCDQNVRAKKEWNWAAFILCWILPLIGPLTYLSFYIFLKKPVCPICGDRNFSDVGSTIG